MLINSGVTFIIKEGTKIKFKEEKQRYTVKALNNRYIICTKPFNLQKTVMYTILDMKKGIRNCDNLIFGIHGYDTEKSCKEALEMLENGEMAVSVRNYLPINIDCLHNN